MNLKRTLGDSLSIVVVFILLVPVLFVFISSFKPNNEIFSAMIIPKKLTLSNYVALLANGNFVVALKNSFFVSFSSALVCTALALPAAYSLARFRFRGRGVLGLAVLSSQMLPAVAILVPIVVLMRAVRLTNSLIGLAIIYISIGLPVSIWILRSHIENIPRSLEESALIDGCTRMRAIWSVVFPLVSPAAIAVGTFAFVLSWGEYVLALSLISSDQKKTLPLALQALFNPYFPNSWGQIMAGGVIIFLPVVILFTLFRRYIVGGLAAGGVKE